jgi:hypothetical protein
MSKDLTKSELKTKSNTSIRISPSFTKSQVDAIDDIVRSGKFGSTRANVVKHISLKYIFEQLK